MGGSLAEARAHLDAINAQECGDPRIAAKSRTAWWLHDAVAPIAVVLVHGFTSDPQQYAQLAPQLAARGHAVIVPRIRYHGYANRLTEEIAALTAGDWERDALDAIAVAARAGERVVVAGISVAGTLCGWLAARVAIDHAIAIAPFCGIRSLPGGVNELLGKGLRAMPNRFSWWDPRRKMAQLPPHAYPRFSTRALGEGLRISDDLVAGTAAGSPHARRATLVQNTAEPIVNNAYARRRFAALEELGVDVRCVDIRVRHTHDVIEPTIPQARPEIVYPRLIELIES